MKRIPGRDLLRTVLSGKRLVIACLTPAVILGAALAAAGTDDPPLPWKITADRLIHEQDPERIIAEGNVFLQQYNQDETPTGLKIEADHIQYEVNGRLVIGSGNLRFSENGNEVRAEAARIELDRQIGVFRQASIFWRQDNLFASADLIEKRSEQLYHFSGGRFTACPVKEDRAPDWSIWGRDVVIALNDFARVKHATFRVRDVPVFYLPYLRLPIGTKKKTGFLFPEYSTSQLNGTGLIAPIFINLAPSYDLTLYPGYYSDRGIFTAAEFRYAAGFNSRGTLLVNYLEDDITDTGGKDYKGDGLLRTNTSRYWVRGKADHDFGNRLVAKLDVDFVSDHDYLQEFQKGITGFDQSNADFLKVYNRGLQAETINLRENTLQLSKIWTTTDLQSEIRIIDDKRVAPDTATPPWALPKVGYSGLMPLFQTPVDFVWNSEYVYYWRDEGVGAHRLNLYPQLNGPLLLSPYLESSYHAGIRETLYFIEPHDAESEMNFMDDFDSRTFYTFQVNGATTLSRDYQISLGKYKILRHAIRPELSYLVLKGSEQSALPFLDNEDRIAEKNWLQYSLNNYLRAIALDNAPLFRSNFSSIKINQVYDLDAGEHPFSDINLEFIIRGFKNLFFRYETSISVYGKGVTAYNLEARYANKRGDMVNLDYHYRRNPETYPPYFFTADNGESMSELRTFLSSRLSRFFSVRFDNIYSMSSDKTVNSTFSLIYHNPCWNLEFAANRTPDDTGFYLRFSLAGISGPLDLELPEF